MAGSRRNRALAVLLLLAVALTVTSSALLVAEHGSHVCRGESCALCLRLSSLHELLSRLGCALLALPLALLLCGAFLHFPSDCAGFPGAATLVSLNVKLSD